MSTTLAPFQPASLADAITAVDQAESPADRVVAAAHALQAFGFDRVLITLRDASLSPTMVVNAGDKVAANDPLQPLPGVVWRRRLPALERFRVEELFLLDGADPWVAREFFAAPPSPANLDSGAWLPTDLVVGLVRAVNGELLGIVKVAHPRDGRRPNDVRRREIAWLLRHLGTRLAYDALNALAQRRAERLQRLQEAGAALARSLDEREIERELARQAVRATRADGVMIAVPDLDEGTLTTLMRVVRGAERPCAMTTLGDGVIAEVARSGRPVRTGDRAADRARELTGAAPRSTHDVVGDAGVATSVLAVPLLVGIRLVAVLAVHAPHAEAFSAEDEEVLATMASQAATAIANARRYAESERERRQTEALADVARAVGESLRLGEVLRLILRHSVALLGAEGACVALRADAYMHIVAAIGAADVLSGVYVPVATSLLGRATLHGEQIVSNDYQTDPMSNHAVHRLAPIQRTVVAPLTTARGIIGALAVINRETPFTDDDARVLQRLADHVAVAIVNARLFEEVERATREWKVAFDAIASGMVVLEEDQRVRRCNAAAVELCGVADIPALLKMQFRDALLSDSSETERLALDHIIDHALRDGSVVRGIVRSGRRGRLFDLTASPHPDGGLVITFDDVTTMHRLADRHRRVVETASDAIVITDLERRVSFANPAAHALFQRGAELIGCSVTDLTAPESLNEVLRREATVLGGTQQRYECQIVDGNGQTCVVSVSSAPLIELEKVTGTVACLRDITAQRADAAALARSEASYARLFEEALDSLFTVDAEGRFTSVNRALERASGRLRSELLGAVCTVVLDPRDREPAMQALARTMSGASDTYQIRYLDADGVSQEASLFASPIAEDGRIVGGLGMVRRLSP